MKDTHVGGSAVSEATAGISMLRITADDHARVLTFRLEGRLEGPWVRELEQCWRGLLDAASKPTISVDLTGVTYIDAAGKAQSGGHARAGGGVHCRRLHDEGSRRGDCREKVTKAVDVV